MTSRVQRTVLATAVLLAATGQPWTTAAQTTGIPVSETIPPYVTLPVDTECEVEPRTKEDLVARIDALEASPQPPGTSSGPLTVVESGKRGVYPDIFVDGSIWIDDGTLVQANLSLRRPDPDVVAGVNQTLQAWNACSGWLESLFQFALFTDDGLDQGLRYVAFGFNLLRSQLDELPPVNDHVARDPTGTHVYSMVAMSDGRVAAVVSITEPPRTTTQYEVIPYVVVLEYTGEAWALDWLVYVSHMAHRYVDPAATPTAASPSPG